MTEKSTSAATTKNSAILRLGEAFNVLYLRNFRLLWIAQVGSSAAQWVETIARGWLIWQLTGSATLLAVVALLRGIPMLIFGLFAGVAADRFNKRRILIICQIFTLINYLILATLIVTGNIQVGQVMVSGFLMGCSHSFEQPSRTSLVPTLVGKNELTKAVALNSAAMNMMRVVGPAAAGLLIAPLGVGGVYYLSAAVYIVTITATFMLQVPQVVERVEKTSVQTDLIEAFRYIYREKGIFVLILLALLPMILGQPYMTLMPVFADKVLHVGASGYGWLQSATGIGGLSMVLFVAIYGKIARKSWLALIGIFCFGAFLVIFSQSSWFALSLLILVFIGFASGFSRVLINSSLLEISPREMHGRLMAVYLLDHGLVPMGTMVMGPLTDIIGAQPTVLIMGSACVLLAISLGIKFPVVRRMP